MRAPIGLYRARLEAVLGSRLLMLEHTGRASGRRRLVVLEVVEHPAPGTWVVGSGFGARAHWFRYAQAHPRAWDHLRPVIEAAIGGSIEGRSGELPMVALEAAVERTPRSWRHRR